MLIGERRGAPRNRAAGEEEETAAARRADERPWPLRAAAGESILGRPARSVRHTNGRRIMCTVDDDALIREYIEENPYHRGPADARLRQAAVPVWALVTYWHATEHDAAQVATDYHLPAAAVAAALAYYRRHEAAIRARIAANAA